MAPDGLAIAQWEGGTEFTLWVLQGLDEPGDLLRGKVHKKENKSKSQKMVVEDKVDFESMGKMSRL